MDCMCPYVMHIWGGGGCSIRLGGYLFDYKNKQTGYIRLPSDPVCSPHGLLDSFLERSIHGACMMECHSLPAIDNTRCMYGSE
jgi:hypothetical protein